MAEDTSEQVENIDDEKILFADFLEKTPPGKQISIFSLYELPDSGSRKTILCPDIQLHCDSVTCQGNRFFAYSGSQQKIVYPGPTLAFLTYTCRNCQRTKKTFAVRLESEDEDSIHGTAIKIGEFPSFGPPIPSRVITLIGPDRENFIRGRRAENQGLGIGAFAYYRRVVENQKSRLIIEISKVAKRLGASQEDLQRFELAAKETQFSKAIDYIKSVIPQQILVNGHNPLALLHSALSEGLHAGTDEECLELATSVRVVLTELSERISQALKDEAELKHAVSRLMQPRVSDNSHPSDS